MSDLHATVIQTKTFQLMELVTHLHPIMLDKGRSCQSSLHVN